MSQLWNTRFNTEQYIYGTEPNVFFKQELEKLNPAKLLLPAEGEGRNAVFAAKIGWQVTAFDASTVAQAKALKLASHNGVSINYRILNFTEAYFDPESFDAIALVFAHMPSLMRTAVHQNALKWLKPGGVLILEGYSKQQHQFNTGGPSDADMLYAVTDLKHDFASMAQLNVTEVITELSEGSQHIGQSALIRVVGVK